MNNAAYDKTMKSLRNRIDVKLSKRYLKWTLKPSYMSRKVFDNDLAAIRKNKVTLRLNKLAYVGMCIFDFCKILIYEFHYDYMKNKYGNKSRLFFTDTNSLMHETKTADV